MVPPEQVCILPWSNLCCCSGSSYSCCMDKGFAMVYDMWGGPWKEGKKIWNDPRIVNLRKRMLEHGSLNVCKTVTTCPMKNLVGEPLEKQIGLLDVEWLDECQHVDQVFQAIRNGDTVLDYLPRRIYMPIHDACNCRCSFCFVSDKTGKIYPTEEETNRFMELVGEGTVVRVSGGDPLVETEMGIKLRDIALLECEEKGAFIEIMTNGQGLSPKLYDSMCNHGPVRRIVISIDTLNPEHYILHRGMNVSVVRSNIEKIASINEQHCIDSLIVVLTGWNYRDVEDVILFASNNRIPSIVITPVKGKILEKRGYISASIFGKGFTEEVASEVRERSSKWVELGDKFGVKVVGVTGMWKWIEHARLGSGS